MVVGDLYINQLMIVPVILDASQLDSEYEKHLLKKLKDTYGNKCHFNGYIQKDSIEITKISAGLSVGAHLTGQITYKVQFKALYCIPRRGLVIRCKIKKINKIGALAYAKPIQVIIPKELQIDSKLGSAIFQDLRVSDYVYVEIADYDIKQNQLVVVGTIVGKSLDGIKQLDLPMDNLSLATYDISIVSGETVPMADKSLGDNEALNKLKDQITPYASIDGKTGIWDKLIKFMINPYELIDIYRPPNRVKYRPSMIKYHPKSEGPWKPDSRYPIFSRAYFKLRELLIDNQLLDDRLHTPCVFGYLAEGPGGFIQSVIDYRNDQYGDYYLEDRHYAITLKSQPGVDSGLDWSHPPAKEYFDTVKDFGYKLTLSYGQKDGDGDLLKLDNLNAFAQLIPKEKCYLVTSDGGVELKTDEEYRLQELFNIKLFYAEILGALKIQQTGGHFIIKLYDIYYQLTVELLELLSIHYGQLILTKPKTSRGANSEKYLVCKSFNGITPDQLSKLDQLLTQWTSIEPNLRYLENKQKIHQWLSAVRNPNSTFKEDLAEFNNVTVNNQMSKINEGITIIKSNRYKNQQEVNDYYKDQIAVALNWCKQYKMTPVKPPKIAPKLRIRTRRKIKAKRKQSTKT